MSTGRFSTTAKMPRVRCSLRKSERKAKKIPIIPRKHPIAAATLNAHIEPSTTPGVPPGPKNMSTMLAYRQNTNSGVATAM
jgi:hypothetical protein